MSEPAKIRNVAVTAGREGLVKTLLFQTGKINRLGSVRAGTTVSDSADDEHERQLSISMSLEHTEWQDRKVNLIDVPGDPAFQGELRCASDVCVDDILLPRAKRFRAAARTRVLMAS